MSLPNISLFFTTMEEKPTLGDLGVTDARIAHMTVTYENDEPHEPYIVQRCVSPERMSARCINEGATRDDFRERKYVAQRFETHVHASLEEFLVTMDEKGRNDAIDYANEKFKDALALVVVNKMKYANILPRIVFGATDFPDSSILMMRMTQEFWLYVQSSS